MSKLEFAAQVISALAWPTVVAVGLILFRKTLRNAVDTLLAKTSGHLEGWGLIAKWDAITTKLDDEATAGVAVALGHDQAQQTPSREFVDLLTMTTEEDGRTIVSRELLQLENELRTVLGLEGVSREAMGRRGLAKLAHIGESRQILTKQSVERMMDIVRMAGLIERHNLPATRSRVFEFLQFVGPAQAELYQLKKRHQGDSDSK